MPNNLLEKSGMLWQHFQFPDNEDEEEEQIYRKLIRKEYSGTDYDEQVERYMLPTKRVLGKRGGRASSNRTDDTDAEANPQIDTGVSSFNNDLGGNPVEARNDPARESGSLQLVKAILIQRENAQLTNCSQLQLSSLTKQ
ncbi:hypothetical protein T01_4957 [Trichinella spiralis]|uniref:Uncharacterized protein n=1 Tax=Trichinella spiralis TaxID=6334 RepID=A0A0V1AVB6_TRISP|nr:hypothetical protein T01_4957 [Trichinella spiralis]